MRSHLCESRGEESASAITHLLGLAGSAAALPIMLGAAGGDPWKLVSAAVFGVTLVLLYASSTLYHTFGAPRIKALFQILDHACIYLLIAGTYTPLTLVTLRGPWGWVLFGIVWALAAAGVLVKSLVPGKKETRWSTTLYLAMGWSLVIAIGPILRLLPWPALAWLAAGGLFYSFGVAFFAWNRLPYNHAVWHLFVLAGSACHVVAVTGYILN